MLVNVKEILIMLVHHMGFTKFKTSCRTYYLLSMARSFVKKNIYLLNSYAF